MLERPSAAPRPQWSPKVLRRRLISPDLVVDFGGKMQTMNEELMQRVDCAAAVGAHRV